VAASTAPCRTTSRGRGRPPASSTATRTIGLRSGVRSGSTSRPRIGVYNVGQNPVCGALVPGPQCGADVQARAIRSCCRTALVAAGLGRFLLGDGTERGSHPNVQKSHRCSSATVLVSCLNQLGVPDRVPGIRFFFAIRRTPSTRHVTTATAGLPGPVPTYGARSGRSTKLFRCRLQRPTAVSPALLVVLVRVPLFQDLPATSGKAPRSPRGQRILSGIAEGNRGPGDHALRSMFVVREVGRAELLLALGMFRVYSRRSARPSSTASSRHR